MSSPSLPVIRPVTRPPGAPARVVDIPHSDARLQRALAWWLTLRDASACALPDRRQVEPASITDLLPWSILWDVQYGGNGLLKYRCRLAGTMLEETYGRCTTGLSLGELYGEETPAMQALFDQTVGLRQPLCSHHDMAWAQKEFYTYHRLSLPFTLHSRPHPGGDPDRVGLLFNVVSLVTS